MFINNSNKLKYSYKRPSENALRKKYHFKTHNNPYGASIESPKKCICGEVFNNIHQFDNHKKICVVRNKFSVIIPLYNNENYIKKTILSVINQTYKNFEIIVVDDCSTDNSYNKVKELQSKYPDLIKLYKNEKNIGVYKSLNNGLNYCSGQMITKLDSDDIFMPTRLYEDNIHLYTYNFVISKFIRKYEETGKLIHRPKFGESMITFNKCVLPKLGNWLNC